MLKRTLFTVLAVSIILAPAVRSRAAADNIPWSSDWPASVAQAKSTHRLLLVDFYTDWCVWCKKLDADVYPKPAVTTAVGQFVPVKLNAEKEGKALANRFRPSGFPTILVLDSSEHLVGQIVGYEEPDRFAADLNRIAHDNAASADTLASGSAPKPVPSLAERAAADQELAQVVAGLDTSSVTHDDIAQQIQAALDKGADINAWDAQGYPALVRAASVPRPDVAQVLLEQGADPNAATAPPTLSSPDSAGPNAAQRLLNGQSVSVADAFGGLFSHKSKPTTGQTALMLAAQAGQTSLVTLLLSHGADVAIKDSRGKTALDYAGKSHDDVARTLKAHGAR